MASNASRISVFLRTLILSMVALTSVMRLKYVTQVPHKILSQVTATSLSALRTLAQRTLIANGQVTSSAPQDIVCSSANSEQLRSPVEDVSSLLLSHELCALTGRMQWSPEKQPN